MNLLLNFSYNGTNFSGYQIQPKKRTIQEEIEKVLKTIFQVDIKIYASGRTDAKVHALNQYANFYVSDLKYELDELKYRMNRLLPGDIYIKSIKKVNENFNARFNAKYKIYEMLINYIEKNPFTKNYVVDSFCKVSIKKCREAAKLFVGRKNFQNFCSKEFDEKNYVRNIKKIKIFKKSGVLHMKFIGDGFMKYQIRMISANILLYGQDKIHKEEIIKRLNVLDTRDASPYCLTGEGLYLINVIY